MKRRLRQFVKLLRLALTPRYRRALWHRVGAAIEHCRVMRTLKFATVVDIGANKGQFSLVAAETFPDAHIVAFEPLREPSRKFAAVFSGDDRVVLHQSAVGPITTTAIIHVAGRDDSSSLLPITALQEQLFPGTELHHTEEIQVGPLKGWLKPDQISRPALLKIDVQGYELEALKGCEALLPKFSHIYVECSFVELYADQALADEVIVFLRERGFRLLGVYNMTYDKDGQAVQADFLFRS